MEISGIDAEFIVTNLMQLEQRPLLALQARQDKAKAAADALSRLKTSVDAFRVAASKLADAGSFNRYAASVSHADIVAASVNGNASAGALTFTVDRLAAAHGLRSVGAVASSSVAVTTASHIAVAAGTTRLGIGSVAAGPGLGAGTVSLEVVQASTAASVTGVSGLAASTVIDASNDTIEVSVDGVARSVAIAHGTYDRDGLVAAVQAGIDGAGGGATASLTGGGSIVLATRSEGSGATIEITGGSALSSLQLAPTGPRTGADGVVRVGTQETTVTYAAAGETVAVDTGDGTLSITLAGGLRAGATDVKVVATGDRSLAAVAAAITSANAGVSAAAVDTGAGGWRLQLTARSTGDAGQIAIDPAAFDAVGGLIETSAAQNAQITIGTGPGAYQVEASGNTFVNVVGGVTLTARSASTTPVTVTVARNDDAAANDVAALVSAANSLLAEIKVQTRYDATTRVAGVLSGNATVRQLADEIRQALGAPVAGLPGGGLASTIGIELGKEGSFAFDRAKFMEAVADDPDAVARLLGRGGTSVGDVVFASATASTAAGAYDVVVTTPATRAASEPLFVGGASTDRRVGVRIGSHTAHVDVLAGQSTAEIAANLNAAFAAAGLDVVAETDGTGVKIRAQQWGSTGDFELNDDVLGAGEWIEQVGTDVAGTIDGAVATGVGRKLSLPATATSPAAGLTLEVADGASGALGAVEYRPGIAARIVEVATNITRTDRGVLTSAISAAGKRVTDFNEQITRFEDRLFVKEATLRRQWANVQTLLGSLQNQQQWITGQLAGLSNNWASRSN